MLTVYANKTGDRAKAYFFSSLMYGDYYTEGQERVGDWWGKGAELLQLTGKVTTRQFCRLVDNQHPSTGERLTLRNDLDRRAGYDLTFSPCKSFSIAAVLLGDERLLVALSESVKATLAEAEGLIQTRVRKDGAVEARYTGNLIAAMFQHLTARPESGQLPDPQAHIHAYVMNATFDVIEHVWKAVEPVEINRLRPYLEAFFHNDLARRVQDLGYDIEAKGNYWEIKGVPIEAIKTFSKRDERIQKEKKAKGIDDPKEAADLGRKTRRGKAPEHSLSELREGWWSQLPPATGRSLRNLKPGKRPKNQLSPEAARKEAVRIVKAVAASAFERSSTLREQAFIGLCLRKSRGLLTAEQLRAAMPEASLEARHYKGALRVTHPEVYREEKSVISTVKKGKGKYRPLAKDPQSPEGHTRDQARAYRHILSSRDQFITIEGRAGTGKTTLAQSSTDAMQGGLRKLLSPFIGDKVVVLAPQTVAARIVLRGDGFKDAETVARFMVDPKLQSKAAGGWVWVDEAGQLGTREARELIKTIEDIGARAVFAGDRKQTRSVSRGRAFDLMIDEAGCRTPRIEEVVRQKGRMLELVEAFMKGDIERGFKALEVDGNLHVMESEGCMSAAAEEYVARKNRKEKAVLIAPTHIGGHTITDEVRRLMKSQGLIKRESTVRTWVDTHLTAQERCETGSYRAGQMVQFNKRTPGFKTGIPYEVVGVSPVPVLSFKHQVLVRAKGEMFEALPMKYADRWSVYDPREISVGVGDEVRITRNMKTQTRFGRFQSRVVEQFELPQQEVAWKKAELANGTRHKVVGYTFDGHFVLEGGKILNKDCGHFTHGYCTTAQGSQSITTSTAIYVGTKDQLAAVDGKTFLVAATRPSRTLKVYTDDRKALIGAAGKDREEVGAFELLERGQSAHVGENRRARERDEFEAYRRWEQANEREHEHER